MDDNWNIPTLYFLPNCEDPTGQHGSTAPDQTAPSRSPFHALTAVANMKTMAKVLISGWVVASFVPGMHDDVR